MNKIQFVVVANNFGEWLKSERKKAYLTTEGLGKKIGKSKQYISALERGEPHPLTNKVVTPKREVVLALAEVLRVDASIPLSMLGYAPNNPIIVPQPILEAIGKDGGKLSDRSIKIIADLINSLKESEQRE